jgi:large-conductance mechanosensitive channel
MNIKQYFKKPEDWTDHEWHGLHKDLVKLAVGITLVATAFTWLTGSLMATLMMAILVVGVVLVLNVIF